MMTRLALTLLTFALSTVAHAGPISWSYTVPTVSVNFPGLRKYEVFGVDNQQMQSDYGDLNRVYLHRGATWDVHPPLVGQTVPYVEYNLRFIITDVASGQSGEFMMPSFLSVHQGWSLFVTSYAPRDTALVLGGNEYRLYNSGSPRDDRPYEIGIVTVKPLITSVPEPGTMALAAIGLAGLGLARWFRRSPR